MNVRAETTRKLRLANSMLGDVVSLVRTAAPSMNHQRQNCLQRQLVDFGLRELVSSEIDAMRFIHDLKSGTFDF